MNDKCIIYYIKVIALIDIYTYDVDCRYKDLNDDVTGAMC